MIYSAMCTIYLEIEADSENEAYEEARERLYRQYRLCPDSIEIEQEYE